MAVERVFAELVHNGRSKVFERLSYSKQPGLVEMAEDRLEPIALDGLHLLERLDAARGDPDEHDPPVVRNPDALDETSLLHAIDDPGRVAERHVEQLRHPAHRQVAVMLEEPHDVHVGHAHAGLHEAAGASTPESGDHVVDPGGDPGDELIGGSGWLGIDSSHDMNSMPTNDHR